MVTLLDPYERATCANEVFSELVTLFFLSKYEFSSEKKRLSFLVTGFQLRLTKVNGVVDS